MASTVVRAEALSFEEARNRVLSAVPRLAGRLGVETVPLEEAPGRVLADALVAAEPFPRFDNTAVDGYAARAADLAGASAASPVRLRVLERVGAGHAPAATLATGEAVLLMTGAPLPAGADCVVMRERCRPEGDHVWVAVTAAPGENVRPTAEDVARGETVLERGRVLAAEDVATLAALVGAGVRVVRRPRVAVLSTGDELRAPGEPLGPGEIHDCSSHGMRALVRAAGAEPGVVWWVRDDPGTVGDVLEGLLESHDAVLTLGGVSAGDFDPVKHALARFGFELWRVAMRPGGPQAFGCAGDRVFYGLPGNPVSSAVVFDRLARPLLRAAMGVAEPDRPTVTARLAETVRSARGRRDFLRVRLARVASGYEARLTGTQSSGAVTSLARADGLAVVPEASEVVPAGSELDVILWREIR